MRGLRRHDQEPGLDEERRRLIHSYMEDLDEPAEVVQVAPEVTLPVQREVVELAAAVTPAPVAPPAVEVVQTDLAPIVQLSPPAPPERDAVDVSRRTLQQVARLCEHVDWARAEGERRRAQLAASAARQRTVPPGSPPAE